MCRFGTSFTLTCRCVPRTWNRHVPGASSSRQVRVLGVLSDNEGEIKGDVEQTTSYMNQQ